MKDCGTEMPGPDQLNQNLRGDSDAHHRGLVEVEETLSYARKRRKSEFRMQPQTPAHLATEHQKSALPVGKKCT